MPVNMDKLVSLDRAKEIKTTENGMIATVEASSTASKAYAVGDYFYYTGKLYKATAPIASGGTITVGTNCALAKLADDVGNLKSALMPTALSDNAAFNEFFQEFILIGVDYSQVAVLAVSVSSKNTAFTFKDSGNTTLKSFTTGKLPANMDSVFMLAASDSSAYMLAKADWSKISLLSALNISVTINPNIANAEHSPAVCDFIRKTSETIFNPVYTRNTSHRINTSGEVVSAGSSWFVSSPIEVYSGDIISLRTSGNVNAAPMCKTDSTGSYYTPCVVYTGNEPDTYTVFIDADGYIAISGYADYNFQFVIYRNTYTRKIINPLNTRITANAEAIAEIEEAISNNTGALSIESVDYGIKVPQKIVSANVKSLDGWGSGNDPVLSLAKKYNNVIRQEVDCVTVTSPSGNGYAYCELESAVNVNNYALMVSVCLGNYDSDSDPAGNFSIELYSGTGRSGAYKKGFTVQGNTNDSSYNPVYNRNGWFMFCVNFLSANNYIIAGESFDPTNVRAVGVHVYNTNNVSNTVHVADLSFVPLMQKPGIVTIIDNFDVNVPAMADYAYSKGVRLNLSIIPGFYAGESDAPTCASKSELDRVAQQGHCIWNHTWTHQTWNTLTRQEIFDEINYAEQWMKQNGYRFYNDFVSVPSARFPTFAANTVFDSNAKMIFQKWFIKAEFVFIPYYPTLRMIQTTELDQEVSDTLTGAELAAVAGKCMTYGGITVIGFHGTYWDLDNGDSWKAYIDAIADIENVYHYGLDEIYEGQWY